MIHISTFSGVGGFELSAQWMGWKNYASCEINPFGSRVLEYYWPQAYHHGDIHTLTYELLNKELIQRFGKGWRNEPIVLTGGFPCQPFSLAGKRKGTEDDRHLWPEMLRLIREIAPEYIVGENVGGIISWDGGLVFEQVQIDLETKGYQVQPFILPACSVNAPHRRDRVWFVAYSTGNGSRRRNHKSRSNNTECKRGVLQDFRPDWNKIRSKAEGCSGERITPHTSNQGRKERIEDRGWQNSEKNRSGLEFRVERSCSNDTSSDSNINTERSPRKSGCPETNGGGYDDEQEKRRSQTEQHIGSSELLRDDADTFNQRLQGGQFNESPDTEGQIRRKQPPGSTSKLHQVIDWEQFPTQPPVRSRNDGISSGLVGITVSKHRNESIRAYGNSVVPPLVLQIFKAIQQYENHHHPQRT